MYSRYTERQGWKMETVSSSESEVGGYKEIIMKIIGHGAYSKLKFESGGHRVQRVPDTETQGRIHTSACTVAVLPEADEISDVIINPAEIRLDTYRASGAGGQHINKTDSAVRITHIPTNTVVQCQDDRSQHRNRAEAMNMLRAQLYALELNKRNEEKQALEDAKTDIGWGHQIRSYVLDQSRIKDLRTNVEVGNTQGVLDGDLDPFISESLKQGV
jgi:peptide chain release factor 2